MSEPEIVKMETIGREHEGQTVTVVGIPLRHTIDTDAHGIWLQDGAVVEVVFDEAAWKQYETDLIAAAVLIRGRVEWYKTGRLQSMRLHAEYAEARVLVDIITESF